MRRLALVGGLVWFAACVDTELPPPPGAGAISGRVLVARPGEAQGQPAAGATVALVEAGLTVTTGEDGRFELRPIPLDRGTLRLASGSLSRVFTLEELRAGPGKQTVLGDVALSRNASIQGEVLLEDAPAAEGTLVFVEGEPASTFTNRQGQFLLRELPVGAVSLAVFREGYAPVVLPLELRSGERFVVDRVVLRPQPLAAATARGQARLADREDSSGVSVTRGMGSPATTATGGDYTFSAIEPGVYSFAFAREGFGTVTLANRLVGAAEVVLPSVVLVPGTSTSPVVVPPFPPYDAGTELDAGSTDAGSELDAGTTDAGTELDAGTTDAGTADAGSTDAGSTDAGTIDAGTIDAGTIDAGTIDAGTVDAGTIDAGTVDAGTADAGPDLFPIALIAPIPGLMLQDAGPILLNGTGSYGTPVLTRYSWLVDAGTARLRDGGVIRPSVNDSATAAAPNLELPVAPAVVTVSLQVTDAIGRVSAPAVTGFVVGDRPLALFDAGSLPTELYSGATATIDATPSRDTVGSNLVSRRWVTSPGAPVTTTPLANDAQLRVDVGTVTFAQQVTVSHYVTNGLGFESLERAHSITLLPGTMPSSPWSVVTSGAFSVDGGTVVPLVAKLDAGSQSAAYADPANYDWAWTSSTDAGVPPQWAITDPTRASTTFIPPVTEGPPVRYDFTVTATARPPLAPGVQSADLVVLAYDRVRPQLVSSTSSGSTGSAMGTMLTFSEAMTPVTNANLDVARMPANVSVITGRVFRGDQMLLVTRPPPTTSDLWEFRMSQSGTTVTDLVGNQVVPLDATSQYRASFLPEVRWTQPFSLATGELTVEPQPAVVLLPTPVLGRHAAVAVARVGSTLVSGATGVLQQCTTPPCTVSSQAFATGVPTAASPSPSAFTHQGTAFFQPVQGRVWSLDGGSLPTAPGLVFSQGTKLGAFSVSGNTLQLTELDGGAWDTGSALTAWTSTSSYPIDGTSVVAAAAGAESAGTRSTCVAVLTGTRVVPLMRRDTGSFGVPLTNNPAASGLTLSQVRVGATSTNCYFMFLQPDGRVLFSNRTSSDNFSTGNLQTLVNAGASEADAIADPYNALGAIFWLATIESGQLWLYYTTGAGGSAAKVLTPTGSLNVDPACVASKPVLSQLEQAVYLTWQEQCAGQPWTVYVRGLY